MNLLFVMSAELTYTSSSRATLDPLFGFDVCPLRFVFLSALPQIDTKPPINGNGRTGHVIAI